MDYTKEALVALKAKVGHCSDCGIEECCHCGSGWYSHSQWDDGHAFTPMPCECLTIGESVKTLCDQLAEMTQYWRSKRDFRAHHYSMLHDALVFTDNLSELQYECVLQFVRASPACTHTRETLGNLRRELIKQGLRTMPEGGLK